MSWEVGGSSSAALTSGCKQPQLINVSARTSNVGFAAFENQGWCFLLVSLCVLDALRVLDNDLHELLHVRLLSF